MHDGRAHFPRRLFDFNLMAGHPTEFCPSLGVEPVHCPDYLRLEFRAPGCPLPLSTHEVCGLADKPPFQVVAVCLRPLSGGGFIVMVSAAEQTVRVKSPTRTRQQEVRARALLVAALCDAKSQVAVEHGSDTTSRLPGRLVEGIVVRRRQDTDAGATRVLEAFKPRAV